MKTEIKKAPVIVLSLVRTEAERGAVKKGRERGRKRGRERGTEGSRGRQKETS